MTSGTSATGPKADLHHYLRRGREAVLWKLDGLSEYDARRPMTPTGTNLLGLVKHLAYMEFGYFGDVFGRPHGEPFPWDEPGADPNADLWATAEESREEIADRYRRACAHADATIEELPLDAVGRVPWWPAERAEVTLHRILVHVATETHRHAGHADIVRELVDGAAGLSAAFSNIPEADADYWPAHRARLEQLAREADRRP
jgi:hypothetical protein